jgi:hypothetical protein
MKKINAVLLTLGIFITGMGSCKKDENSKVDCEIKLVSQPSPNYAKFHTIRYNSAGQVVAEQSPEGTFLFTYSKNEVTVRTDGRDVMKVTLENGRAIQVEIKGIAGLQKFYYDATGRIRQTVMENAGVTGSTRTYNYLGENLDNIVEEYPSLPGVDYKYAFEYTDLKFDAATRSFHLHYGPGFGNMVSETLLGKGSVNLPSKITQTIGSGSSATVILQEYTYTTSQDGKITAVNIKRTAPSADGIKVTNEIVDITSSCQ